MRGYKNKIFRSPDPHKEGERVNTGKDCGVFTLSWQWFVLGKATILCNSCIAVENMFG
jgi:hypothetical protein